jgi:hypothetical protein
MVCMIALLHSSIDFSLQIAGYSIVVFALLGLGVAQSLRADEEPEIERQRRERRSRSRGESGHPGRQPARSDAV